MTRDEIREPGTIAQSGAQFMEAAQDIES